MKIAALYDIHANLPALEAVLAEVENLGAGCLVIGGDVIAGPMPIKTLNLLAEVGKKRPLFFIHGNHESEMLRADAGEPIDALSERAVAEANWLVSYLPKEMKEQIASWPMTQQLTIDGLGEVLFCHATPQSDTLIFTEQTAEEQLRPLFASVTASLVVCGHTHMQFDRQIGDVRVVNAGSVGLPIGHTGANWLLFDGGELIFKHTTYDLASASGRIRQADYPEAENFAQSSIIAPTSKEKALERMAQLAAKQI